MWGAYRVYRNYAWRLPHIKLDVRLQPFLHHDDQHNPLYSGPNSNLINPKSKANPVEPHNGDSLGLLVLKKAKDN